MINCKHRPIPTVSYPDSTAYQCQDCGESWSMPSDMSDLLDWPMHIDHLKEEVHLGVGPLCGYSRIHFRVKVVDLELVTCSRCLALHRRGG